GGRDRGRRRSEAAARRHRPAGLPGQLRQDPPGAGLRARVDRGGGDPRSRGRRAQPAGPPQLPESRLPQRPGAEADAHDAATPERRLDDRTRADPRLSVAAGVATPSTTDFLVVGGGILALTLALELKRRHGDCSVTLLEKERACGLHASGRNSGVLHAGFYYRSEERRVGEEGSARGAAAL